MLTSVVGDEEANIGIVQHGSNSNEPSAATRYNRNVFPRVLAGLGLAMHLVVQIGHCLSQRLDPCGWAVLTALGVQVDGSWTRKATLNVVLNLLMSEMLD